MDRVAKIKISHIYWSRNDGYQYVYHTEHAPWILPRLASDHPMPQHIDDVIKNEESKYEKQIIHNDTEVVTLTPKIDHFRHIGNAWMINLGWYTDDGTWAYGDYYQWRPPPEWHQIHQDHVESITQQIPITLDPGKENGIGHYPGTGPTRNYENRLPLELRLEHKNT